MKSKFFCPHCKDVLNPEEYIVLLAKNASNQEALIKLSPRVANYHVQYPPKFVWKKGENLEISCPSCKNSLKVFSENNRAKVLMEDAEGKYNVIFSTEIGEHVTYVVTPMEVKAYGPDAKQEKDLWQYFTW